MMQTLSPFLSPSLGPRRCCRAGVYSLSRLVCKAPETPQLDASDSWRPEDSVQTLSLFIFELCAFCS